MRTIRAVWNEYWPALWAIGAMTAVVGLMLYAAVSIPGDTGDYFEYVPPDHAGHYRYIPPNQPEQ
jgi:hypothetical protein